MLFYGNYYSNKEQLNLCTSGCYAHGKLEDLLKYDTLLVEYTKWNGEKYEWKVPLEDGIYKIRIKTDENEYKAILYYWNSSIFGHRGLAVLEDDLFFKEDAENKFIKKEHTL